MMYVCIYTYIYIYIYIHVYYCHIIHYKQYNVIYVLYTYFVDDVFSSLYLYVYLCMLVSLVVLVSLSWASIRCLAFLVLFHQSTGSYSWCFLVYVYMLICWLLFISLLCVCGEGFETTEQALQGRESDAEAVGSHSFNLQHFKLRVSNPRTIAYVHSNCPLTINISQGLGPFFQIELCPFSASFACKPRGGPSGGTSGSCRPEMQIFYVYICTYIYVYMYIYIYICMNTATTTTTTTTSTSCSSSSGSSSSSSSSSCNISYISLSLCIYIYIYYHHYYHYYAYYSGAPSGRTSGSCRPAMQT